MARPSQSATKARVVHRYLGFFLAGVMAMYAISGIVLIFRNTDFLKREITFEKQLEPGMDAEALGELVRVRNLKQFERTEGDLAYFEGGTYNMATGEAKWSKVQLPVLLENMTKLHKATTKSPLYFLNIFFGLSLLTFVITSFWMYLPGGPILRKGLWFALGGVLLVVIMLMV